MKKLLAALTLCSLATLGWANEHLDRISGAAERMDAFDPNEWTFKAETTKAEEIWLGWFDPTQDPVWQLSSVDGKSPTQDQVDTYLEEMREGTDSEEDEDTFLEFISPESLKLTEQKGHLFTYQFKPIFKEFSKKNRERVQGEFVYNSELDIIQRLTFSNTKPIKFAGGAAKLEKFHMEMTFTLIGGKVFLDTAKEEMNGKFAFVKSFEENKFSKYYDAEFIVTN